MKKSQKKLVFTLAVLFTGSAATIFMLLLASANAMILNSLTEMPKIIISMNAFASYYIPIIWIPSLIALFVLLRYGKTHYPELTKKIWIGIIGGLIATFALDTFRELGVIHKWLPDTIMMFGKMIAGMKSSELTWVIWGNIYHFLNGMSFGIFFVLIFRKGNWITWGIIWGLLIELGMMMLPPMAPMFGLLGIKTGSPALFIITLIAHIAYGLVLGLWVKNSLKKN